MPFRGCCPFATVLQLEPVSEVAVDLGDAVQHAEGGLVLFASEGGGHAREVADRCDRDAHAGAEVLARRRPPQVVVAAGSCGLGNDLQLTQIRLEIEHIHGERERLLPVPPSRVQLTEGEVQRRRFSSRIAGTTSTPFVSSSVP
jgi:hypothetical protein